MGPYQEVMFEGENITLDIPMEGITLENGWTISPDTYPGVSPLNTSVSIQVDYSGWEVQTYIKLC